MDVLHVDVEKLEGRTRKDEEVAVRTESMDRTESRIKISI